MGKLHYLMVIIIGCSLSCYLTDITLVLFKEMMNLILPVEEKVVTLKLWFGGNFQRDEHSLVYMGRTQGYQVRGSPPRATTQFGRTESGFVRERSGGIRGPGRSFRRTLPEEETSPSEAKWIKMKCKLMLVWYLGLLDAIVERI